MSVLLVGLPAEVALATTRRLCAAGDEVRLIAQTRASGEAARAAGAHVAVGEPDDADLIERAAQNVRTVAFGDEAVRGDGGEALIAGGTAAQVGRWIYCSPTRSPAMLDRLREGTREYVALMTVAPTLLRRRGTTPEEVAAAIDAADDLAGEVRLELDLKNPEAWRALKLEQP